MSNLQDLLERVAAATEPDRELDCRLFADLLMRPDGYAVVGFSPGTVAYVEAPVTTVRYLAAPHYTSSLDSALALVERVLPGWWWGVSGATKPACDALLYEPSPGGFRQKIKASAKTPTLALLAATLRALIAQQSDAAPHPHEESAQSQPCGAPKSAATEGEPSARIVACPECNGDGGWERPTGGYNHHDGSLYTTWSECRECDGTGEIEVETVAADFADFSPLYSTDPEMDAALRAALARIEELEAAARFDWEAMASLERREAEAEARALAAEAQVERLVESLERIANRAWSEIDPLAYAPAPPEWAKDSFNGDCTAQCGCCGSWMTVVRPGKVQCDTCSDGQDLGAIARSTLLSLKEPS